MTTQQKRPNIALIAGGYSGESVISLKSAAVIMKNIDVELFNVYLISVTHDHWTCLFKFDEYPIDKNDFSVTIKNQKINFDAAFVMIHGTPGEDGVLQGYFDMLGIPYTSCNATVSAVTFNKFFCNRVVDNFGAKVAKSVRICSGQTYNSNDVIEVTGLPCFVKPNAGGSSIGTSKVHEISELKNAIDIAFEEDDEVLIEQFISGREMTCGVIKSRGNLYSFPLTEVVSKKEFFDYEAKYDPTLAEEITPAVVDDSIAKQIRSISEHLYVHLNCNGVVRFDYIVSNDEIWFLEVNTIPGMSAESIVPQQAKAFGWSYTELTTRIIEEALALRKN